MELLTLMNTMNTFIQKLAEVSSDDCSDEFLTALNDLVQNASDLSVKIQLKRSSIPRVRRPTTCSSSSDDVQCTSEEIVTVNVDSGSEDSDAVVENEAINSTPSDNAESTVQNRVNEGNIKLKRCAIKLRRVDMTGHTTGQARQMDDAALSQNENVQADSRQVSAIETENISDTNSKSLGYHKYLKRCLLQ